MTIKAIVKGRVQGVGYRFFVEEIAYELGIKGYVRNLFNGNVEVVAHGKEEDIKRFIARLRQGPSLAYIADIEIDWNYQTEDFADFTIRY